MAKARAPARSLDITAIWREEARAIAPISAPYAAGRVALRVFQDLARSRGETGLLRELSSPPPGAERLPPGFEDLPRAAQVIAGVSSFHRYPSVIPAMARVAGTGAYAIADTELGIWVVRDRRGGSPELEELGRGIAERVAVHDTYKGTARGEIWLVRVGRIPGYLSVALSVPLVLRGLTEEAACDWIKRETGLAYPPDPAGLKAYGRWVNDLPRWAERIPPLILNPYADRWEVDGVGLSSSQVQLDPLTDTLDELLKALTTLHWAAMGRGDIPLPAATDTVLRLTADITAAWAPGTTALRTARIGDIVARLSTLRAALEAHPGLGERVLMPVAELVAWGHLQAGNLPALARSLGHCRLTVFGPRLKGLSAKDHRAILNSLSSLMEVPGATVHYARWFAWFTPSEKLIALAATIPRLGIVLVESAKDDVDQLLRLDAAGLSCRGPLVRGLAAAGRWSEMFARLHPWPEGVRVDDLLELAAEAEQIEALRAFARNHQEVLWLWLAGDEATLLARSPRTAEPLLDQAAYAAARLSGGELLLAAGNEWLSPRLLVLLANLSGDHDPDRCREVAYGALTDSFMLFIAESRPTARQISAANLVLSRYRQLCDWEGDTTRREALRARLAQKPAALALLDKARL